MGKYFLINCKSDKNMDGINYLTDLIARKTKTAITMAVTIIGGIGLAILYYLKDFIRKKFNIDLTALFSVIAEKPVLFTLCFAFILVIVGLIRQSLKDEDSELMIILLCIIGGFLFIAYGVPYLGDLRKSDQARIGKCIDKAMQQGLIKNINDREKIGTICRHEH